MSQSARQGRVEVTTRMPVELAERVRQLAADLGISTNEYVCRLIEARLPDESTAQLIRDRAKGLAREIVTRAIDELNKSEELIDTEVVAA